MWKEFSLINSFTLECTFCGPSSGLYKDCHFTTTLLKDIGKSFCSTLRDYTCNDVKVREVLQELEVLFPPPKPEDSLLDKQDMNKNGNYPNFFGIDEEETNDEKSKGNTKNKKKSNKTGNYKK